MHQSAMNTAKLFFDIYATEKNFPKGTKVLDVGSQDVNGSLKEVCPKFLTYMGVDFVAGKGVDIVLQDPYKMPFEDEHFDIIICSSVFEHSQMFWLLYLEIMRILKPKGIFYLNVPSTGEFHRYPVDCWRFYPDSANALVEWAKHNHFNPVLLESFICTQDSVFSDCVAVFLKDATHLSGYPKRILDVKKDFINGLDSRVVGFRNHTAATQDILKLQVIQQIATGQIKVNAF
jgi:SAM-dependent methyltransferase